MSVGVWILMCMRESAFERLQTEVAALIATWAGAPSAGDAAEHGASADGRADGAFGELSDAGLARVVEQAGRVRRAVDALLARAGDEVARRSAPGFGAEGFAKRRGFATPAKLVAAATGGAPAEAARLVAVGEATRERESFTGALRAPKFEHVRAGLDEGAMSLEAANLITGMLARVELRADPVLLGRYERNLSDLAAREPLSLLGRAVKLAESHLDPAGVAPGDADLAQERSLSFREDANGMFHLRAKLDPVTAAPVKAALDAMVSDALRRRGDRPHTGAADVGAGDAQAVGAGAVGAVPPVVEDRRSIAQLQADAFADLARHVLGCAGAPGVLPKTTVVVRMGLQALLDGIGTAEIDGVDRPIAAGTARRLAADAELIPAVLGTESLPLDLGRSARLFSRAQRLALAERDGGCASCGANVTYADAHHIDWWTRDAGPTDLSNGVMLCTHCHHQIHDHGWDIRIRDDLVWFIPPPHIDPDRAPRIGGRARFDPSRPASNTSAA
jgi:hypothetical protein